MQGARQIERFVHARVAHHRSEGHELGVVQPLVQPVVDRAVGGRGHDGACAQGSRAVFATPEIEAQNPALREHPRRHFDDPLAHDERRPAAQEHCVGAGHEIAAEVEIPELFPPGEKRSEAVALHQQLKHSARGLTLIGHRGIDEDFVEGKPLGDALGQFDVGENAARDRQIARTLPLENPVQRGERHLLENLLHRGGDILTPPARGQLLQPGHDFAHPDVGS